ncbi:hypothetical protein Cgig2_011818 [Carnegiea gigantea]|uniref:Reverse transcriptase n=1 Tax=Carnegiea gigantea TaxID=171969 RepID=A0A9Q1JX54_9CARY|nr:hypothetical protein Cgig2_011818 [Carnegiea gigantea]
MFIDADATITVRKEAFKRKLEDAHLRKNSSLGLLWDKEVKVRFLSCSLHHIDVIVQWVDDKHNGVVVEERLDRYCANINWSLYFPNAHVTHIDYDISDHLPMLLKCNPSSNGPSHRTRRFHLENMWFTDPSCKEIVASAWSLVLQSDPVDNLLVRIANCSRELTTWNHRTFSYVGNEIKKLKHI